MMKMSFNQIKRSSVVVDIYARNRRMNLENLVKTLAKIQKSSKQVAF